MPNDTAPDVSSWGSFIRGVHGGAVLKSSDETSIALPYSEDGYYALRDLPRLISEALVPPDQDGEDELLSVTIWRDDGSPDGLFLRCLRPDALHLSHVEHHDQWSVEPLQGKVQIDIAAQHLLRVQRLDAEHQERWNDGSLIVHYQSVPTKSNRELTRHQHAERFRRDLDAAATSGALRVDDSSGLPLIGPPEQGVVHLGELNRWSESERHRWRFTRRRTHFDIPLMPAEVPALLHELPPDSFVDYTTGLMVGHTSGATTAAGLIGLFQDRISKRAKGRYSLIEAATLIATDAGESFDQMLNSIAEAAIAERLAVHERGKNATFDASSRTTNSAMHLESTAAELNRWLADRHPLIEFRFRMPIAQQLQADEPRRIGGRRLWRLSEAIDFAALTPGFGVSNHDLRARLSEHDEAAKLKVADLATGKLRAGTNLSVFLDEPVFADDFNAWLGGAGYREPFRLPLDADEASKMVKHISPHTLLDYAQAVDAIRCVSPGKQKNSEDLMNWLMTAVKEGVGDEELRERDKYFKKLPFNERCRFSSFVQKQPRTSEIVLNLAAAQKRTVDGNANSSTSPGAAKAREK